ncbi:MAG: glutathione S-transferase family protein [Sphingorhabdus sp.]
MNMTLYHGEPNGPSLTVMAALAEKGLVADLVSLNLAKAERHGPQCERGFEVDMSIEGEGPVLVVDGEPMADSVFIACFLDEIGTGPKLRPDDPYERWEVMMWCRQIIERLAPAAAYLGIHSQPAEDISDAAIAAVRSDDLRSRWQDWCAGNFDDDKLADSRRKVLDAVDKCEARLDGRDWLMGDFSIADLETFAWIAGMVGLLPDAFAGKVRTEAWLERVRARPSVGKALSLARTDHPETHWAPGPEINRWG